MKTHWPFGGFFLKLSDEKNGTHEYEDYLKECEGEKQMPEEELEFHYSKDPKKMTMQESLERWADSYAGTGCRRRRDGQSWRHRKQPRAPQSRLPGYTLRHGARECARHPTGRCIG